MCAEFAWGQSARGSTLGVHQDEGQCSVWHDNQNSGQRGGQNNNISNICDKKKERGSMQEERVVTQHPPGKTVFGFETGTGVGETLFSFITLLSFTYTLCPSNSSAFFCIHHL